MASTRYLIETYKKCLDKNSDMYRITGRQYPNVTMIKFIVAQKNCPEWISSDAYMQFDEILPGAAKEESKPRKRVIVTYGHTGTEEENG